MNGTWHIFDDQIAQVVEQYFQELFTSTNPTSMESVLDLLDNLITPNMNNALLQWYMSDEVRQALFQMHPSKSLGLDGMSPFFFFFPEIWNIVRHDVIEAVLLVLNSEHMLHKMNYTHIVLIPKKNDPMQMFDYRPISLGNVISRILSKVIVNRLKHVLPNVIFDAQSAFVPDQLVIGNTTVAYELLHRMRNK